MVKGVALALAIVILLASYGCADAKCADNNLTCSAGSSPGGYGGTGPIGGGSSGGSSSSGGASSNGGASGNGGSSNGGSNLGGKGPMIECPPECVRPINCVKTCGGPSVSLGCCPCVEPAFDDIQCGQGGSQ